MKPVPFLPPQMAKDSLAGRLRSHGNIRGFPTHGVQQTELGAASEKRDQFNARTMRGQAADNPASTQLDKWVGTANRPAEDRLVKDFRWPDAVDFNWALDWFDQIAAGDRRNQTPKQERAASAPGSAPQCPVAWIRALRIYEVAAAPVWRERRSLAPATHAARMKAAVLDDLGTAPGIGNAWPLGAHRPDAASGARAVPAAATAHGAAAGPRTLLTFMGMAFLNRIADLFLC